MIVDWPVGERYTGDHERIEQPPSGRLTDAEMAAAAALQQSVDEHKLGRAVDAAGREVEREVAGMTVEDLDVHEMGGGLGGLETAAYRDGYDSPELTEALAAAAEAVDDACDAIAAQDHDQDPGLAPADDTTDADDAGDVDD